jgi:hypothetical protein
MAVQAWLKYAKDGSITPKRRDYSEVWRVVAASPTDTIDKILNASGLPAKNAVYDGDYSAGVVGYKASRIDREGIEWEVTVDYASGDVSTVQPPTGLTGKIHRYAGEPLEQVATVGYRYSGGSIGSLVAIRNSAGDPFVPPPMSTKTILVITTKGNYAGSDVTLAGYITSHMNTINSGAVTINGITYPAFSLMMRSIEPEPPVNGIVNYSIVVAFKQDLWKQDIQDAGYRAKFVNGVGGYTGVTALRQINRSDCQATIVRGSNQDVPLGQPVMLDGDGHLLGNVWPYNPDQSAQYLSYITNDVVSWGGIGSYL